MISSTQIKSIRSLHQKKFRDSEKLFLVEGEKLHQELFLSDFEVVNSYATAEWLKNNENLYQKRIFTEIADSQLQRISALKTPNKILSVVKLKNWPLALLAPQKNKLTLVLDTVSDPGNLGTIIRTANWFGIKNIVCSPETVELHNPKVVQASMGSVFFTPVFYQDLPTYLSNYNNIVVHGAMLKGESLFSPGLTTPSVLVLGNESRGISAQLEKFISKKVSIPSFGNAESLNVTVACGIFCATYKQEAS